MNIGRLDRFCRIERKHVAKDSTYNTETITWTLVGTAHCALEDILPGRAELVKNGIALAVNPTRVRMRYRTDIDSSMRLVVQRPHPVVYQIIAGPAEIGNKVGIEMIAEKTTS